MQKTNAKILKDPLVTIICLSHNQSRFVAETLQSVFDQSYANIQTIVIDDGSEDESKGLIKEVLKEHPGFRFLDLPENLGNTKAFNLGLAMAQGKYIIDLACDDLLEPERVERQVEYFESLAEDFGVIYSDANFIREDGSLMGRHFESKIFKPFEGDVFERVIAGYFIPPPTMMIRKSVLNELHGYDENLVYEDFDFWVRSARKWKYGFQTEVLTKIRKVAGSHSTTLYKKGDQQLKSTIQVCRKIEQMIASESEKQALIKRLRYEMKHAFLTGNNREADAFFQMLQNINGETWLEQLMSLVNELGIDWSFLRSWLLKGRRR